MEKSKFRYDQALRRLATSRGVKLASHAAAGVALTLPAACGNSDASTFAEATTLPNEQSADLDNSPSGESAPSSTPTTAQANTDLAAEVGADTELLVSFTYEASSTDRAKRPYIAVWIEDTNGALVDTVSLWYDQGEKGQKWLDDLRQWYNTAGLSDTTMSSATRVAGDYVVAWDATDIDGNPVLQGDYVVFVEAAREHGPTSLTSATISIGEDPAVTTLADDEELSAVSTQLLP